MQSVSDTFRPLLEAASLAARAHHGQMRKDKATPYVSHVFRVCLVVRDVFGFDDPRMLIAALLHDTIEDTTTDFDDIEGQYGAEIAQWVAALTKNKAMPETEREADYIKRLLSAPWQVRACKLADVFDNLMDLPCLPPEKRAHSLSRVAHYVNAIAAAPKKELKKPLDIVKRLLAEIKKQESLVEAANDSRR